MPVFGAPLRFIYAFDLKKQQNDDFEPFQFSIGTSFYRSSNEGEETMSLPILFVRAAAAGLLGLALAAPWPPRRRAMPPRRPPAPSGSR